MPLILGANSLTGGYEVDNSLRFNSGSSDSLSRTFGAPTSGTTWTINFWVKKSSNGSAINLCSRLVDGSNEDRIRFTSGDALEWSVYKSGSYAGNLVTTQLFRDNSAWYNILCVWDTSNATAGDRMRMYLNGSEITAFSTDTNPSLNTTSLFNASGSNHRIGSVTSGEYFNGYMSEVILVDGQQLAPSDFGEFDEDSGIWKPIRYTGTYGTNGFYLEFKDSSALGDDTSGNGNDFTVNNLTSIDQTTDTPTNNFATMNPLATSSYITLSNGNLTATGNTGAESGNSFCNYVPTKGKWYVEYKVTGISGNSAPAIGIRQEYPDGFQLTNTNTGMAGYATAYEASIRRDGQRFQNNVTGSWGTSYTTADIISIALDCDNGAGYIAKNGTYMNSGDPTSGASKTGAFVVWTQAQVNNFGQAFAVNNYNGSETQANFGNPPFTISSGNSDANGYGNFEYAVPSGYYALNTKNLAEYG